MSSQPPNRRRFLQLAAAASTAVASSACGAPIQLPAPFGKAYKIPRRSLGKTGETLSVVGFGGIVVMNETPESAASLVKQAIDRDINYFDVAPAYGNAQDRLGPALEPYRKGVFLACKTERRTKQAAQRDLTRSLELLRTDHLDLYQFHAVTRLDEVDTILGPGGAMETFLDAREKGLIRFIGFSAHSEVAALALLDRFKFDTMLFPVNWVCWHQGNFGPRVLAKAQQQGLGILALKALALEMGKNVKYPKCWYKPVDTPDAAALGLRFTLSRPVTAAVSPSHAELLWWMCDAAERLKPLTQQEEAELAAASKEHTPVFAA